MVGGKDDEEVSEISEEQVDDRRFPSVESLEWHMKSHSEGYVSSDDNQEQNRSISEEEMSTEEVDMRAKEAAELTLMMICRDKTNLASTSVEPSDENSAAIEKNSSGEESEKPQVSSSSLESQHEEDSGKTRKRTRTKGKKNKIVKLYKCPFCSRVFNSDQALGGHERTHQNRNSAVENRDNQSGNDDSEF